jgi:valyl-tRNA synthetase
LRLLHPFTPFITEELWGHLKTACQEKSSSFSPPEGWSDALMIAKWPTAQNPEGWEDEKIKTFALIQDIVRGIRNVRTENKLPPSKKIAATIAAGFHRKTLTDQKTTIAFLSGLDLNRFEIHASLTEKPVDSTPIVITGVDIYLSLNELVDNDAEVARLTKELLEINNQIDRLEQLLDSSFAEKAPPQVVAKEKEKLSTYKNSAEKLTVQINLLK